MSLVQQYYKQVFIFLKKFTEKIHLPLEWFTKQRQSNIYVRTLTYFPADAQKFVHTEK